MGVNKRLWSHTLNGMQTHHHQRANATPILSILDLMRRCEPPCQPNHIILSQRDPAQNFLRDNKRSDNADQDISRYRLWDRSCSIVRLHPTNWLPRKFNPNPPTAVSTHIQTNERHNCVTSSTSAANNLHSYVLLWINIVNNIQK